MVPGEIPVLVTEVPIETQSGPAEFIQQPTTHMSIIKRIANFFGFKEAKTLTPAHRTRKVRTHKQIIRDMRRDEGIPAAKRHRIMYYRYNPSWFNAVQSEIPQ